MKGICRSILKKYKAMASKEVIIKPIVNKVYYSSSEVVFMVRRRPNMVNGGGFVVVDSDQRVVFRVDGYGLVGKKEELILRDGDGNTLLLIKRKPARSCMRRQWRGYANHGYLLGSLHKFIHVFTLKEPDTCFSSKCCCYGELEIRGDFRERRCSIVNSRGDVIAEIGVMEELEHVIDSRDLYNVRVKPGIDQAFVFGVIAVLDYIYDGPG